MTIYLGTRISVFGLLPPGNDTVTATYLIDGEGHRRTLPSTESAEFIANQTYFRSSELSNGGHNLTIVVNQASASRMYTLDRFQVVEPLSPATGTNPATINIGLLVGGIVGAVAFSAIVTSLFWRWRTRIVRRSTRPSRSLILSAAPESMLSSRRGESAMRRLVAYT